jgi:hypothetical protein
MKFDLFDDKDKKVIELLSNSKQDFVFDQKNVKARLLMALGNKPAAKNRNLPHHNFIPNYRAALVFCIILVVGMGSLSFASNKASPGETLYSVQKLQNNLVLSLPLADESKAQYRTDIVAQRLEDLDRIESSTSDHTQIQAEIKASEESIEDAVSNVAIQIQANQNNQKILSIIQQLDELSTRHQEKMETIKDNVTDEKIRAEIDRSLELIRANTEKLRRAREGNGPASGTILQELKKTTQ